MLFLLLWCVFRFQRKLKMSEREVLNEQSRRLVLNVVEYFQNKKETSTEKLSVIRCSSEALKLSTRTISRIRQEGPIIAPAKRKAAKTRDLPDEVKAEIRSIIYNMIENKEMITRENLRRELLNRHILDVCNTTLGIIVKSLGFRFTKDNGKRALKKNVENPKADLSMVRSEVKSERDEISSSECS